MLKYHLFAIVNLFRRSSVISFSLLIVVVAVQNCNGSVIHFTILLAFGGNAERPADTKLL